MRYNQGYITCGYLWVTQHYAKYCGRGEMTEQEKKLDRPKFFSGSFWGRLYGIQVLRQIFYKKY